MAMHSQLPLRINYKEAYQTALTEFAGHFERNEFSNDALEATTKLIRLNSSFYAAWTFRRLVLKALAPTNSDAYLNELHWTRQSCRQTPKSFQVWYHRQEIFAVCSLDESEDLLIEELVDLDENIFALDAKNYHAWSYRIWLVGKFSNPSILQRELKAAKKLISDDPFNNSAWNFCYFLHSQLRNDALLSKEIEFVVQLIHKYPQNEASWNYLKGIYELGQPFDLAHFNLPISFFSPALSLEEKAITFGDDSNSCSKLFAYILSKQLGNEQSDE